MQYHIMPVTPYQQNCSLIWCEHSGKAAFIDPGGETSKLVNEVQKRQLNLDKIFLTHGHLDHVGAADEIAKQFNVSIIGPQIEDAFWFEQLPAQAEMFNFPPIESFLPTQWLNDGDRVTLGEINLQVFHCPGHTPGHIVFYEKDTETLFAGDVIFKGSIGRTDFPKGDHATLIQSIKQKLFTLNDDVVIVPGHGPNTSIGQEKASNPFLR